MNWREDKTLIVLGGAMVFYTLVVLVVVGIRPEDTQLYTLFASTFGNFSGALMLHLTRDKAPPPGSTIDSTIRSTTKIPPDAVTTDPVVVATVLPVEPIVPATVVGGFGSTGAASSKETIVKEETK